MAETKTLGLMRPVGGGDPVPLRKGEVIVGRRPSCDIRLDFENVSGRHCILKFVNGTWHIRDLGSTNGTKLNGAKVEREQGVMPDDELAIASHLFTIDYEPAAPLLESQQVLEEETGHVRRTSLMELAGIDGEDRARPPRPAPSAPVERASEPAGLPPRGEADEFKVDLRDEDDREAPDLSLPDEDEFLRMIEDDMGPKG